MKRVSFASGSERAGGGLFASGSEWGRGHSLEVVAVVVVVCSGGGCGGCSWHSCCGLGGW